MTSKKYHVVVFFYSPESDILTREVKLQAAPSLIAWRAAEFIRVLDFSLHLL